MTTTEVTTDTTKVMTKEELVMKYYDFNLDMCKKHIKGNIADSKKIEMALIVARLEDIFTNYITAIENLHDKAKLNNTQELKRIFKLEIIEQIIKF